MDDDVNSEKGMETGTNHLCVFLHFDCFDFAVLLLAFTFNVFGEFFIPILFSFTVNATLVVERDDWSDILFGIKHILQ